MKERIRLKVNGREHEMEIDPETPLLYALRNNLALNGAKYGCGIGQCGACMVLLNGNAQTSCNITCTAAVGYEIVTIEGIGGQENMSPVQQAFVEEQAAQCGYCANGMVMTASALLSRNANPTNEEIKQGMNRVLCRCGTHSRILKAVKNAAAK
ncbi:(2Fe-2S)-binding protein [Fulvivirgaceae bacterium LMO-SS25]